MSTPRRRSLRLSAALRNLNGELSSPPPPQPAPQDAPVPNNRMEMDVDEEEFDEEVDEEVEDSEEEDEVNDEGDSDEDSDKDSDEDSKSNSESNSGESSDDSDDSDDSEDSKDEDSTDGGDDDLYYDDASLGRLLVPDDVVWARCPGNGTWWPAVVVRPAEFADDPLPEVRRHALKRTGILPAAHCLVQFLEEGRPICWLERWQLLSFTDPVARLEKGPIARRVATSGRLSRSYRAGDAFLVAVREADRLLKERQASGRQIPLIRN